MKKRVCALLLLFLLCLLTACGQRTGADGPYRIYFLPDRQTGYGSALAAQDWEGTGTPLSEELMQALLDGPTQEGLVSPFPRGLSVQSLELEGDTICVTLSEHYSGLTDMAQTLADACIVMTLCQLPGVEAVEISADGFWASRPASRTLTPEQLELSSLLR